MLKRILGLMLALFAAMAFAAVDVNNADATQLDSVKGIGPAIAGKITAERKKAPFKDWDDLIGRVSGIGEKTAAKLSEGGLTVNGAPFKGIAAKPAATPAAKPAAPAATPTATAPAATPAAKPADAKAPAATMSADEKKAAAKAAKEEKAAAKKKASEEKAAAAKAAKEEKAAKASAAKAAASAAKK